MSRPLTALQRTSPLLTLLAVLVAGLGCGSLPFLEGPARYRWFEPPAPDDPWSLRILRWQARATRGEEARGEEEWKGEQAGPGEVAPGSDLGVRYRVMRDRLFSFPLRVASDRRQRAAELVQWLQDQASTHYRDDGPRDYWPTLSEALSRGAEDCDGLELLAFHLLRELGFGKERVLRGIVSHRLDGRHHMVTFWFEDPNDPWVIDPTGIMASRLSRMSELPGWTPLKLFSERREYTVLPASVAYFTDLR